MSQLGNDLLEGMKNAVAYAKGGEVAGARSTVVEVPAVDVGAIRRGQSLTQKEFAATFGFSLSSVRNWEQGLRRPQRAARLLLALIERQPQLVRSTLAELDPAA